MGASPQMVDWDQDGDMDLLVGEYDGHIHYFQNIGTATNPVLTNRGHLLCAGVEIDVSQLAIPVVNDWDQDGRKDLIVGNDIANIRVYLNTGTNSAPVFATYFLLATNPAISQIKNAPDIGDLNGDGLKDLAFGWWQGTCVYYPNSGTNAAPVFNGAHDLNCLGTVIDPGGTADGWTHLEMNDWDQDGDLDLLYGQWLGTVNLYLNVTNQVHATAIPINPPIMIPQQGGSFSFNATVTNNTTFPAGGTVWTMMVNPSGQELGPYINANVTIPAGGSITRARTQNVPGSQPPGIWQFVIRWGVYPNSPWAENSFNFTVSSVADGGPAVNDWNCSGEPFSALEANASPDGYALLGAYPNPFNPTTSISYNLPNGSNVSLKVFDSAGRLVTTLVDGWRSAGSQEVTFDGSGLASGVYLYTLSAGDYSATGKMVMLK